MRLPLLLALCLACFPVLADSGGSVGYATVQEAYEALRADPNARASRKQGWLVIAVPEGRNEGLWAFTPIDHPAFPSTVRRTPKGKDEPIVLDLRVLCGARKAACDQLVEEFKRLDEEMAREGQNKR